VQHSKRIVLLLVPFLIVSCTGDPDPSPGATSPLPSSSSTEPSGGEESPQAQPTEDGLGVLYLDKKTVKLHDVGTDMSETIGKLPSVDAIASPDGRYIAYVTSSNPGPEDEDFVVSPELHVYEIEGERDTTVGSGLSVLWHPDGDRFAYLEPGGARVCEGETCEGTSSLQVADVVSSDRTKLLDEGTFVPLAWMGDDVVVSQPAPEPATLAVTSDGTLEELGVPPSEFWGASPDGKWIVRSVAGRAQFVSSNSSERGALVFEDSVLGEGGWSPDSQRIAAVLLKDGGNSSELVLAAPDREEADVVEASRGAAGPVLWAPDSSAFVYTRSTGSGGLSLEAVLCEIEPPGEESCEPLFTWPRGVTLLALS
jgi:hypothetical protein